MVGLCLVAVFAIAAVAASSASATTPEWGKCVAKAGGKYLDGGCQTKGKGGSFEWEKGSKLPNVPFTGHSIGSGGVLTSEVATCENGPDNGKRVPRSKCIEDGGEINGGVGAITKVECEKEASSGEATGKNKIANVHVAFTGCKTLGAPCTSAGAAEGEIKTNPLKGELGYINKSTKEVGVKLEPATKHGHFAAFECAVGLAIVVGVGNKKEGAAYPPENKGGNDQILSPISPVNEMTSSYTQVYTVNYATGENIPNKFEGKPISLLEDYIETTAGHESSTWSRAGEEITNVNTPAEPGEIKA